MSFQKEFTNLQNSIYGLFEGKVIHESIYNEIEYTAKYYAFKNFSLKNIRNEFDNSDFSDDEEDFEYENLFHFYAENYANDFGVIFNDIDGSEQEILTEVYRTAASFILDNQSMSIDTDELISKIDQHVISQLKV